MIEATVAGDLLDGRAGDFGIDASGDLARMRARAVTARTYLDSSAIVKLVQVEPETAGLRRFLRRPANATRVTSPLARVEVTRAVAAGGPRAVALAGTALGRLVQIALSDAVLDRATRLPLADLRSLDAIHLASAMLLGEELTAVVSYDRRMLVVAESLGLPTAAPGLDR